MKTQINQSQISPLPINLQHSRCGVEVEYAFVKEDGNVDLDLINSIDSLADCALQVIRSQPANHKIVATIGGFKEEVFKHQIESRTKVGSDAEVESRAGELHDLLLMTMKEEFGLIASTQQPVPFPGGGVELLTKRDYYAQSMKAVNSKGHLINLVTPRDYYIEAINDISETANDFSFARQASTSSIHLHRSLENEQKTMQLYHALAMKTSQDILRNPNDRYLDYGMGKERYTSRSNIVSVRKKLGEVMNGINDILIPNKNTDRKSFVIPRYFDSNNLTTTPKRDHGPRALKKPSTLTVEGRTVDGPGKNSDLIKKAMNIYHNHTTQAILSYNNLL